MLIPGVLVVRAVALFVVVWGDSGLSCSSQVHEIEHGSQLLCQVNVIGLR